MCKRRDIRSSPHVLRSYHRSDEPPTSHDVTKTRKRLNRYTQLSISKKSITRNPVLSFLVCPCQSFWFVLSRTNPLFSPSGSRNGSPFDDLGGVTQGPSLHVRSKRYLDRLPHSGLYPRVWRPFECHIVLPRPDRDPWVPEGLDSLDRFGVTKGTLHRESRRITDGVQRLLHISPYGFGNGEVYSKEKKIYLFYTFILLFYLRYKGGRSNKLNIGGRVGKPNKTSFRVHLLKRHKNKHKTNYLIVTRHHVFLTCTTTTCDPSRPFKLTRLPLNNEDTG